MATREVAAGPQRGQPTKLVPKRQFVAVDAERAVLGAVFNDPDRYNDVAEMQPADFGVPAHAAIFEAMQSLAKRGLSINDLTVYDHLRDHGALVLIDGPAHVELQGLDDTLRRICNGSAMATSKAVAEQVARVRDMSQRRAALAAAQRIQDALHDMNASAEELLLRASGDLAALAGAGVSSIRTATDFMREEVKRIKAIQSGSEENIQYLPTGLEMYDEVIGGVPRGVVTVVGGQASAGKSTALATMALSMAEGGPNRKPEMVAFFSLEDKGGWMARRWLAESTGFAIRQLLKKGLSPEAVDEVEARSKDLADITDRILIDDRRRLTVHKVAAKMRQLHARHGVRVFIVDHLLEMLDKSQKAQQARDLAVGEILEVLRDVAIELDVAVILACHLRDPETPGVDSRYIRPKLQDFAGGQFISRMARVAVGIWLQRPPKEPDLPKPIPQPRFAAKATADQQAAGILKWQQECAQANSEYTAKYDAWRAQCQQVENSLVFSVIKATEGSAHIDFTMERVQHAGLLRRTGGQRSLMDLGYTPPPTRRR